jgi:hypothetical protein
MHFLSKIRYLKIFIIFKELNMTKQEELYQDIQNNNIKSIIILLQTAIL